MSAFILYVPLAMGKYMHIPCKLYRSFINYENFPNNIYIYILQFEIHRSSMHEEAGYQSQYHSNYRKG